MYQHATVLYLMSNSYSVFSFDVTVLWNMAVCLGEEPGKRSGSFTVGYFSSLLDFLSGKNKTIGILVISKCLHS